jgi:hypothetical protein
MIVGAYTVLCRAIEDGSHTAGSARRSRLYSSARVKELTVWTRAADGPYLPNELTLAVRAKLVRVNARG